MVMNKKFLLVFLFLLFLLTVYAQRRDIDTTLRLEEVVVTGSRSARHMSQSPGRIVLLPPGFYKTVRFRALTTFFL